jgi:hypothetical protein
LFGTFFALFTWWCFGWVETRGVLWLIAWFVGAFALTYAVSRAAVLVFTRFAA